MKRVGPWRLGGQVGWADPGAGTGRSYPEHNASGSLSATLQPLLERYLIILQRPSPSLLPPSSPPTKSNIVSEVYYFIQLLSSLIIKVYYEFNRFLWLRVGSGVTHERLLSSKYNIAFMSFWGETVSLQVIWVFSQFKKHVKRKNDFLHQ